MWKLTLGYGRQLSRHWEVILVSREYYISNSKRITKVSIRYNLLIFGSRVIPKHVACQCLWMAFSLNWRSFTKKEKFKIKKKNWFWRRFSVARSEKKRKTENRQICVFGFHTVARKVNVRVKFLKLYFWFYSQIWLNPPRDGWSSLFSPSFYGWYPH
jgi:hypothetical protein